MPVCAFVTTKRRKHIFFHSDTNYAVVGGQHISAAMRAVYLNMLKDKGCHPNEVPEWLRCVYADVLKLDCPDTIARLAAGQHQRQQYNAKALTTEEILKALVSTAKRWHRERDTVHPSC